MLRFLNFFLLLVASGFFSCSTANYENIQLLYKELILNTYSWEKVFSDYGLTSPKSQPRKEEIKSIILHTTGEIGKEEFLRQSISNGFFFHLLISKEGNLLGDSSPGSKVYFLTPALDESTVHIIIEGTEEEALKNKKQIDLLQTTVQTISSKANISLQNKNIIDKKGIFTHTQVKKKYGFFTELTECGGENLSKQIISNSKGNYFPEAEWQDRFAKDWIVRKEKIDSNQKPKDFDRGRGITIPSKIEVSELEKNENGFTPEKFRLKYVFKETIRPSCIVLHFTAIPSFQRSQDVLEMRKLSATIMVDKDAKAYQLLDSLEDMAQAASGTNQSCIQIEIVGRNTEDLMQNEPQAKKVASLVKEISAKYKVPLTNQKIESLSGIFSHTQAKKKFGGSAALIGKEFDPGEVYMEKILKMCEGNFFTEENWFERNSNNWVMIFREFQP
ncbi:MAG: N-acetylmuramoyl-L-alanine amidase [Chitinophagaceae bacterium]|nr:N-acetylmuramoyl-L-alanine amidase [Chitinophagaceae bacterium]